MTAQKTKPYIPKHLRGVWEQINDAVRALGNSASTPVTQIKEGVSYSIIKPMETILRLDDEELSLHSQKNQQYKTENGLFGA